MLFPTCLILPVYLRLLFVTKKNLINGYSIVLYFSHLLLHFYTSIVVLKMQIMKKILLLFAVVLLSSCATSTSFNDFYQSNQKDSEFSFGMNVSFISSFLSDEDYEDIKPLLKKAKHVRILVFSENTEDMNVKFDRFIKRSQFEDLIQIKEDNDKVKVFVLEKDDRIKEIVVEVASDGDLVLLGLKTNLTQKDIDRLLSDNDISFN